MIRVRVGDQLQPSELVDLDDELLAATGLHPPTTDPLVHWSPSVEVRIGYPRRLSAS